MARPKRTLSAVRRRWERTRMQNSVRARITASLRKSLCYRHFFLLCDDIFKEEMEEVSIMISEAGEAVEEMVYAYLPFEGLNQEQLRVFKDCLKTDMGEPIREYLAWGPFIKHSLRRCADCRKREPILINSYLDAED